MRTTLKIRCALRRWLDAHAEMDCPLPGMRNSPTKSKELANRVRESNESEMAVAEIIGDR